MFELTLAPSSAQMMPLAPMQLAQDLPMYQLLGHDLPPPTYMQSTGACRNYTGYTGVRERRWGVFAAEIRDGHKRR